MILWKFTLREVKSRPGRATLTLLSIVIGVAAVVAVTVSTATTHQACQEMYERVAGRAALEVAAEGAGFFSDDVVRRIEQVPGVKAAVPSVQKISALWHKNNHVRLLVMGIDPAQDEAVRDYELKEGQFFREKYDALLETGFAHGLHVAVGDEVKLAATRGGLSGGIKTFEDHRLALAAGHRRLQPGRHHLSAPENRRTILFPDGERQHRQRRAEGGGRRKDRGGGDCPDSAHRADRPLAHGPLATGQGNPPGPVEVGLDCSPIVMMIGLALFTIFNTFLMNVGERRKQLAVLRAIGATRRQIIRMLLLEGLAMGLVGTVLGSLLGLVGRLRADPRRWAASIPRPCRPCASPPRPSCWPR